MKIAIVHDWLVTYAGAERVLEQILICFPEANLYSIVDFIPSAERKFLLNKKIITSFVQKLPFAKKKYRSYLPLMPLAIEQFDLSNYDLIISSSHAIAKGVITGPNQLHICYIHTPMRYAWDLQHQYLTESNLNKGFKGFLVKCLLHRLRQWDLRTSNGVDYFIANSNYIAKRVWKTYRRECNVIYPPVDVKKFELYDKKDEYYLTASRMVPYKKIDLIVEAFSKMPEKKLVVIGDGPDFEKIKRKASKNIELLGYQPISSLKNYIQRAKAFVFAAEEDFGISVVEAQACGTPVIAYAKGGVLETINPLDASQEETGVFFYKQDINSLIDAVTLFEKNIDKITPLNCRKNSLKFSIERFKLEFSSFVKFHYHGY